jgi:methionyl-tRNA formyltransferase
VRVSFFGTSEFALPALQALVASGHDVRPTVTAPPKPSGRGHRLLPSPVETCARELGLQVLAPDNPNAPEFVSLLKSERPDISVLVAYGYILRQPLLDVPRLGFLNVHPSLLPAYRGAAPIQRALMDGVKRTGVSVIAMARTVDAGDVVARVGSDVGPDETAGELSARLAVVGARLLLDSIEHATDDSLVRIAQDPALVTKAPKIRKLDRIIDWSRPAEQIHNSIRGLSPDPGAVTRYRGRQLVLLRTRLTDGTAGPGQLVIDDGLKVGTGSGLIELLELRPEGGRTQTGKAFANGHRPGPGERFTS